MKSYKTVFVSLALLAGFTACHNKGNQVSGSSAFELSGKLSDGGAGMPIYLDRISQENTDHLDSTKLGSDGTFSFHTKGISKGFYILRLTESDFATLILDSNEQVHVEGNAQFLGNTYSVTGSPDTKLFCELNNVSKVNYGKRDSLRRLFRDLMNASGGNKKRLDSLNDAIQGPYDTLLEQQIRYVTGFIKAHPSSFASLAAIEQLDNDKFLPYYGMLDSGLSKTYPKSSYVSLFHKNYENMKRVAIGVMAPEISLPDTNGKTVTLSSFRGKLVLVDFWASWCPPCKASLPTIVSVYNKYKNKNFTILSVSLDKDKSDWLGAIHKFHLKWTQVSDLKYWDSKVVSLYNFSGIPFTVLVSPEGKIIDKNMKEEDLDAEIGHLLDSGKM